MFTPEDRDTLRAALIMAARNDERISGAALVGSAAVSAEDRWSDIDLALSVAESSDRSELIADWTDLMYREIGAAHHVDVVKGNALYRVFLLRSTLQVDLAFWPEAEFGAIAPTFRLLFGASNDRPAPPAPSKEEVIGMGWLYALHARSSIARGRVWQAEYMISGMRDQMLALACLRCNLPAVQGRGMDRLPRATTTPLSGTLVRSLDGAELRRAFALACELLLAEVEAFSAVLAHRLAAPIRDLAILCVAEGGPVTGESSASV